MFFFITRRVNLERRRGDYDKCAQLYEGYIASAKSKAVASALAIKYARFLFHVRAAPDAARAALDAAVRRDPLNARLHAQRLDLALHTPGTPYHELDGTHPPRQITLLNATLFYANVIKTFMTFDAPIGTFEILNQ